ncbi:MAG: penicillin acylase family protein [Anaerolineae bacterium]
MLRTLLRSLQVIVLILVLVALIVVGGGYWFVSRSFPQTGGTLQVRGLKNQVQVIRDSKGVPHIYADNIDDLFFAQGYVQAQDRLWQMELDRHVGHGQLAELFGDIPYSADRTTVDVDKFLRTIGLDHAARADLAALDPQMRGYLQKYADGVNAFIHTHSDTLPIEFTLLGVHPADWQPLDSLVWAKVLNYDLGMNYPDELMRVRMVDAVGAERAAQLFPPFPADGPFIISPDLKKYSLDSGNGGQTVAQSTAPVQSVGPVDLQDLSALNASLNLYHSGIGSNNWVVDGTRSTTGKPLLANDPHLGISMPSVWYMLGLHCQPVSDACPLDVVGFGFPGAPGVVIGHNQRIAWGVTNTGPDVQDLYIEKVNPNNPNQYWYQGQWQDMQVEPQVIHVNGGKDVSFSIQYTRHGPVMTPVLKNVTTTLALQWTATREPSTLFHAVYNLDRAQNWDDFRNALKLWDAPAQNFVYADIDGNIGYQMPGRIPIRAQGTGMIPVDGSSGEYEWTGYVPFEELPFLYNPSSHYIATANNQVVPNDYRYFIARDYDAPFRARRINALIQSKDKLSPADFQQIQGDLYAAHLVKLQKYIVTYKPTGFLGQRALTYVQQWDGMLKDDSVGGTILEVTYMKLLSDLFQAQLGTDLFNSYADRGDIHRLLIDQLLDDPNNVLWDNPATPQKETRDDRLLQAYLEGVDWLGSQFGDWPPDWQWGRIHTVTFAHPFGSKQPLDRILNYGPARMVGDGYTVDNSHFEENDPYTTVVISSMREIIDLSNLDQSLWIQGTGESGQALSPHYTDLTPLWRDVKYVPFLFTRTAVDKDKAGMLTLTP